MSKVWADWQMPKSALARKELHSWTPRNALHRKADLRPSGGLRTHSAACCRRLRGLRASAARAPLLKSRSVTNTQTGRQWCRLQSDTGKGRQNASSVGDGGGFWGRRDSTYGTASMVPGGKKKRKLAHAHCPLKGPRARSPRTYSCPEISQKRIWK